MSASQQAPQQFQDAASILQTAASNAASAVSTAATNAASVVSAAPAAQQQAASPSADEVNAMAQKIQANVAAANAHAQEQVRQAVLEGTKQMQEFLAKNTQMTEVDGLYESGNAYYKANLAPDGGPASWHDGISDYFLAALVVFLICWIGLFIYVLIKYGLLGLYFEDPNNRTEPFFWGMPNPSDLGKRRGPDGLPLGEDGKTDPFYKRLTN